MNTLLIYHSIILFLHWHYSLNNRKILSANNLCTNLKKIIHIHRCNNVHQTPMHGAQLLQLFPISWYAFTNVSVCQKVNIDCRIHFAVIILTNSENKKLNSKITLRNLWFLLKYLQNEMQLHINDSPQYKTVDHMGMLEYNFSV